MSFGKLFNFEEKAILDRPSPEKMIYYIVENKYELQTRCGVPFYDFIKYEQKNNAFQLMRIAVVNFSYFFRDTRTVSKLLPFIILYILLSKIPGGRRPVSK